MKHHPLQTFPQLQQQQQQHLPIHQGIKLIHGSGARGKESNETRCLMASLAAAVGISADHTPISSTPSRIHVKGQRRYGGGNGVSNRIVETGAIERDNTHRQPILHPHSNGIDASREEKQLDEREAHVRDVSFEGAVDELDELDHGAGEDVDGVELEKEREREREAAARAGGYWRPVECRQTTTMKSFAFP
jgi:hypothetical protein